MKIFFQSIFFSHTQANVWAIKLVNLKEKISKIVKISVQNRSHVFQTNATLRRMCFIIYLYTELLFYSDQYSNIMNPAQVSFFHQKSSVEMISKEIERTTLAGQYPLTSSYFAPFCRSHPQLYLWRNWGTHLLFRPQISPGVGNGSWHWCFFKLWEPSLTWYFIVYLYLN